MDVEFAKKVLLLEYERACRNIVDFDKRATQVTSILFPAATIAVSLTSIDVSQMESFKDIIHMLIASSCLIINVFALFSCKYLIEELRLGAYVKNLENKINYLIDKDNQDNKVLRWETEIVPNDLRRIPTNLCLFVIEIIVFISMMITCLFEQIYCLPIFRIISSILMLVEFVTGTLFAIEYLKLKLSKKL